MSKPWPALAATVTAAITWRGAGEHEIAAATLPHALHSH
jgi:hypothetical protein